MLLDLWVAEPLGLAGARARAVGRGGSDRRRADPGACGRRGDRSRSEHRALHWPLAFPEVFAAGRGFDAVVGNRPWEEVTVEELAFYARYQPGSAGFPSEERNSMPLASTDAARPELIDRLADEQERDRRR